MNGGFIQFYHVHYEVIWKFCFDKKETLENDKNNLIFRNIFKRFHSMRFKNFFNSNYYFYLIKIFLISEISRILIKFSIDRSISIFIAIKK